MAVGGDELTSKVPRALVVPGSGQGHIKPCMLLSRALAALGFEVSFIYFSSEYAKLSTAKKRLPEPGYNARTIEEGGAPCRSGGGGGGSGLLSTAKVDKGFLDIHVLEDGFAPGDVDKPFFSTPAMQESLVNLISELREQGKAPTCLIADPFYPWTQQVAERAGIPFITYWTSNAMSYLLTHLTPHLFSLGIFPEKGSSTQWKRETPLMIDLIPGLPPISSEVYPRDIRFADASNTLVSLLCDIASCTKHGERMLIHALSELEADAFRALQVVGISGYAIGPLLHHDAKKQEESRASAQTEECVVQPTTDCIAWLNTQAESSVIYISFGSQASISAKDIQELALGLEDCGNAFLWVIRDDSRSGQRLSQMLPDGFLERTSGKGMIMKWAPQVEVLAHKAVGGFLTHCGWNSTLESLWEGVPMLCCPIFADQCMNSHYMCDVWGVGLELQQTDTGRIERRNVEVGVKGLMQEEEGLKARGKAQEVKELARRTCQQGGQSFSNLQKFYEDMKELCCKE